MIFQLEFCSVFLLVVIILHSSESLNLQNINKTLFVYKHPSNCKRNEFYNLDSFSCNPCDSKANLQPSFDKFTCECASNSKPIVIYDAYLNSPICAEPCENLKNNKCRNITTQILSEKYCSLKYINFTVDQTGVAKHIRIYPHSSNPLNHCSCDTKHNYLYGEYCIWKVLLKNYLNFNAFRQRGNIYADLKFIAFFCQSLQNTTACNHLANLCIHSFFDTDKNSPCSVFLLAQAFDATLYSSMDQKLNDFRPYLFYKRGKDTAQEVDEKNSYPFISNSNRMSDKIELFTTVYSLNGLLTRWGQLRLNDINLCGHHLQGLHEHLQYFKNFQIGCELSMETVVDLATLYSNNQFINVFLNHTKDDNIRYMHTIPVKIENAFDGNTEPNIAEWQLVKRFQIIGAHKMFNAASPKMLIYEDSYKLRLFKSIRILRKFELRCSVTEDNKISTPLIVLSYHQIDISPNTSLNQMFKFELAVKFEKESTSATLYKMCIPVFIAISFGFAIFRSYIVKRRRNSEYFDMAIVLQFFLHFISNLGNSFLFAVLIDVFYSVLLPFTRPNVILMLPQQNVYIFEVLIYSAVGLKGFYFSVYYWKIAHNDIFFVDWERPKGYDASLHLKNNLETTSQCSSIRTFSENNVSAWRIFFVANEWIELSGKQSTSTFIQGLVCLTVYWIINSVYPSVDADATMKLFTRITIFSVVHIIQRMVRYLIINQILGSPLQQFMDICAMANISIFTLVDASFGFYIHGRSPHGFSDTDMSSMILQLQRESQNMCGKRGLLSDSDFQTYVILLPSHFRTQIDKLIPLRQTSENLPQVHFNKDHGPIGKHFEGSLEKTAAAYNRVNRFFCAFIDHAIKDMDYIIKEKSFLENLLSCEFKSFIAESKGTFYIDDSLTFSSLFLYGNQNNIFGMELLLLIAINLLTYSFVLSIVVVCILNKFFQTVFRIWVRNNVATKTLIDKRFLM